MNIWVALNGTTFRRTPQETVLRPTSFPHFVERPNELRTMRAQRWRQTYKELSQEQHQWVFATVYWEFATHTRLADLMQRLRTIGDVSAAQNQLSSFQTIVVADPTEVSVSYRLLGSSKTHTLTLRSSSPSQQ